MAAIKTRRILGMHQKLLYDTILRQAGTLEKANVEGVMNSIEAGASFCRINLLISEDNNPIIPAIMTIKDDGRGIRNKQEIIEFFETFGTPHSESECTTWKQFRMGRGQMFAYGKNIWRTSTFRMTVDIKNWGLEYDLEENLPYYDGCDITIELYDNPINFYPYRSMDAYKEAIQKQVRFVSTPIYFNGEQINTSPSDCNWDSTDEQAYYLFNVGTDMFIYNLGIFVQKIPASCAGMGGIIVSKKQLKVNFARNDVISDCPIMLHINNVIKDNRIKKTRRTRRTLNIWERQATLTDLRDKTQNFNDIKTLALIPTSQGKHISLQTIRKNRQQWCFAPSGDRLADRIMERNQALCIDENIMVQLSYSGSPNRFFTWLTGNDGKYCYDKHKWTHLEKLYIDYDVLTSGVSDTYSILPDKQMKVTERRIIKVLNSFDCWGGRVINLGLSERASAWTDGYSYITIDKYYLDSLYLNSGYGINKLMMLLVHEMAHNEETRGTHIHGPEFYENMVRILESDNSPTICSLRFLELMHKSKIEEKRTKEREKKEKTENKINKKLGLAVAASEK